MREPVSDETSPLFAGPLAGHEALADCPDFQMIDLMSRGADFTVTIDCNGEMKWALYESTCETSLNTFFLPNASFSLNF